MMIVGLPRIFRKCEQLQIDTLHVAVRPGMTCFQFTAIMEQTRKEIKEWQELYNADRPHTARGYKTSAEYTAQHLEDSPYWLPQSELPESHMY